VPTASIKLARWAVVLTPTRRALLNRVATALAGRGIPVRTIEPDEELPAGEFDAVVVGPKDSSWIERAKLWYSIGKHVAPNPYVVEALRNRMVMRELLRASGFGVPPARAGTALDFQRAQRLSPDAYPVIVKGLRDHGNPVVIVHCNDDFRRRLDTFEAAAELHVESVVSGSHGTAYFIGAHIEMFERQSFFGEETEVKVGVPNGLRARIAQLRALSGLNFGKVDIVLNEGEQPVAVDLGTFPKFLNVPGAASSIAQTLRAVGNRRRIMTGIPHW
jgi:hypothetical protein